MKTYETIIDLLNQEGPGLQDYVTPDEIDRLIDGTLAPAEIADQYLADLADAAEMVAVATPEAETRRDLLVWIRWEIEIAVEQRTEDIVDGVRQTVVDAIRGIVALEKRHAGLVDRRKMALVHEARALEVPKAAIADALGITRPTLDKWIAASQK